MAPVIPRLLARGLPRLALLALVWAALTGGVFSGCRGLFTPATPPPPTGEPLIADYRSPELTLQTMSKGMQAKGDGASAWLGAFPDSSRPEDGPGFHQFFDRGDVAYYYDVSGQEAPADWDVKKEREFYLEFLNVAPTAGYDVTFEVATQYPDPTPGETEREINRRYRVDAVGQDENSQIIAIGIAHFTFTLIGDRWLITKWQDQIDETVGVHPVDPEQQTLGRRRLFSR